MAVKHLALFLLATLAHADIYIQRVTSEQTDQGYIFQFVQNGVSYCWAMPQMLDQSFIPPSWMPVPQAAIDYRWPVMTGDAALACLSGPPVHTVIQMNEDELPCLYIVGSQNRLVCSARIPGGLPCGDVVSRYHQTMFYYRSVTHAGMTGMALCY